jgi:hypothetical protein
MAGGETTGVRRRTLIAFAGVALVLLASEVAARALDSRLPRALTWQSAEADDKVDRMDALERAGGASVVFVGSSLVNAGIDPGQFGDQLGGVTAYNAALSAAIPVLFQPWMADVVVPRLHPKVVVIGVTSFDFTDHPSASAFYKAFADSVGGRAALGKDNALDDVDRWLHDHSELWAHKFALRDPDTVIDAIDGSGPPPDPLIEQIEPSGHTIYKGHGTFSDRPDAGPPIGAWTIGKDNPAALRRLIDASKAQGTKVVLVDTPVTDEYVSRHPHGAADFATYLDALRKLGADTGTPVLEFDGMRDHAYFADVVHLNAAGVAAFTPRLLAGLQSVGVVGAT